MAKAWFVVIVLLTFIFGISSEDITRTTPLPNDNIADEGPPTAAISCYSRAVHDELLKVIDFVKAHTENDMASNRKPQTSPQQFKKFQEDEDYEGGGGGGLPGIGGGTFEVGSLVPMIFKLVGSAISLNSSGLVEGSFGLLPVGVSNQITNVLGKLANNFLGPGIIGTTTRRPPPRRRRTRSTTTAATEATTTTVVTEKTETKIEGTTTIPTETASANNLEVTNSTFEDIETKLNETLEMDIGNITQVELTTEEVVTTEEVLFKESSLGENPVYAAAYAPNYQQATTPYPVYANSFPHALYTAPSTIATTTTSTSAPSTSTDPNSYAVELPFDYMEGIGFGTAAPPMVQKEEMQNFTTPPPLPQNITYAPLPVYMQSTPEYEYEYEEHTDEAKVKRDSDETSAKLKR